MPNTFPTSPSPTDVFITNIEYRTIIKEYDSGKIHKDKKWGTKRIHTFEVQYINKSWQEMAIIATFFNNSYGSYDTFYFTNPDPRLSIATLTKTTISFANTNPDTILDSSNSFVTTGFLAGNKVIVTGSTSNNGTYTLDIVTAGTITLIDANSLTVEPASASITMTQTGGTYNVRFFNDNFKTEYNAETRKYNFSFQLREEI